MKKEVENVECGFDRFRIACGGFLKGSWRILGAEMSLEISGRV